MEVFLNFNGEVGIDGFVCAGLIPNVADGYLPCVLSSPESKTGV